MKLADIRKGIEDGLLVPVRSLRLRYVPLLTVYFAQGASGLSSIAENFWVKERLSLSAEALIALGVWLTIPWTAKMVIGQFVDCVAIFGSRRRVYVFIGAALMAAASLILSGTAGGWLTLAPAEVQYIVASFLAVIGLVVQDVVADTMSTEVVNRTDGDGNPLPEAVINQELGMIQVLGRLSLALGAFCVAGLGGWLANIFDYETVFLIAIGVPAMSVLGALLVRLDNVEPGRLDVRIMGGGVLFAVATVALGLSDIPYSQEIVFIVSMIVVVALLRLTIDELPKETQRQILLAAVIIFVFRAMPGVGPGNQWWQIDVLGFDPAFFGVLAQLGAGLSIAGTWVLGGFLTRTPLTTILLGLTIVSTVMTLPNIALYYGIHHWTEVHFGFGARTIAILDSTLESPFSQLSMIPLLTLIAIHAPPGRRATWFALMASLMNLALNAGGLATKYLNKVFLIERGVYADLGMLLITVTVAGFVLPAATILLLGPRLKLNESRSKFTAGQVC